MNIQLEFDIENQLLLCNPILEAFGNAKTTQNDNSSRFGKFINIFYDGNRQIQSVEIKSYLLEQSRITATNIGTEENNYHIFYLLLNGAETETLNSYFLEKNIERYQYLNRGISVIQNDDQNEQKIIFSQLNEHLKKIISPSCSRNREMNDELILNVDESKYIDALYRILAAIIHLGNISFLPSEENMSNSVFENVSRLLDITIDSVKKVLTTKVIRIGREETLKENNLNDCLTVRDSLSRLIYDRVFNWLIKKMNRKLSQKKTSSLVYSIGILDIFGFENFTRNSFEQLCINYANEKIQQCYIQFIFKSEIEEMLKDVGHVPIIEEYPDNQNIIDLLEKKPNGILQLLKDSTALGHGKDETLLKDIKENHKDNSFFKTEKIFRGSQTFSIIHSACTVEYNIEGLIIKKYF